MRTKRPIRTLVAYHEAGHAVATVSLGGRVERVSIIPTAETLGLVSLAEPAADAWASQIVNLAGDIAVAIYRPDGADLLERHRRDFVRPPALNEPIAPTASDYENFGAVATLADTALFDRAVASGTTNVGAFLSSTEIRELVTPTIDAAWELLERHWRAVRIVAEELLLFGTLDGPRVAEVVNGPPRPGAAWVLPRGVPLVRVNDCRSSRGFRARNRNYPARPRRPALKGLG